MRNADHIEDTALHAFVGGRIRELRAAQGLTIAELAGAVGASPTQLRRIELGEVAPFAAMVWRISQALAVSVDDLHPRPQSGEARADRFGWAERIAGDHADHRIAIPVTGAATGPAAGPSRMSVGLE
jgi:transcriptional regulator with XRE-family HTH domain